MKAEEYSVHLTGRTDLVLHNNQCVDPLNPLKKEIAAITGKRKKTDADHLQVRKLEFIAGLYHSDPLGPFLPAMNLRKMLIEGARKEKNGKQFESGCFVQDDAPILYDGPRDMDGLVGEMETFAWSTVVGNQKNSIIRTRPRFKDWKCEFDVIIETSLVSKDMLESALANAALSVGIGDGRSIGMGRFDFEVK